MEPFQYKSQIRILLAVIFMSVSIYPVEPAKIIMLILMLMLMLMLMLIIMLIIIMALPRRHFHRVALHPPGGPTALRPCPRTVWRKKIT